MYSGANFIGTQYIGSLIGEPHLNLASNDPRLVACHSHSRILNHRSRRDVILPPVPRARDDAGRDRSFGEWTAAMKTDVVDGVEGSVEIEERDPAILDRDLTAMAGRNVADSRDGDEIGRHQRSGRASSAPTSLSRWDACRHSPRSILPPPPSRAQVCTRVHGKHGGEVQGESHHHSP